MITVNDEMKKSLSRFLDSDGKIIVTEDMPDDLKAAIRYLNANNVNLLEETTPFVDDIDSEENEDTTSSSTNQEEAGNKVPPVTISEDQNIQTDDLEQLF